MRLCVGRRAWISKYMYKDQSTYNELGYGARATSEVESYWDQPIAPLMDNNGLLGQLFEAKEQGPGACDPVIGYRGTVFSDMQGLKVVVRLDWGILTVYIVVDPSAEKIFDWSFSAPSTDGYDNIITRSDSATVAIDSMIRGQRANLDVTLTLDIYASQAGDWAANLRQGLGQRSEKYERSIVYGREGLTYLRPKILAARSGSTRTPKVYFTGHSLGGGFASAAATVAVAEFPDLSILLDIYNSAGLHSNTVGQSGNGPQATATCPVRAFTVRDEILTTLQSDNHYLPFVGTVMKILRVDMAKSLGSPSRTQSVHPVELKSQNNLFPLDLGQFPRLREVDDAVRTATSVGAFTQKLNDYLISNYGTQVGFGMGAMMGLGGLSGIAMLYQVAFRRFMEDTEVEQQRLTGIMEESLARHGMDYVIASYEAARGSAR